MFYVHSLAQFCEIHGPNVIFSTYLDNGDSQASKDANEDPHDPLRKFTCESCNAFGSNQVYFSCTNTTDQIGAKYISCKVPKDGFLRSLLKKTATRCLSCEVCDEDGMMLYCDSDENWILCHLFHVRDAKARGYSRSLAVLFITNDLTQLLSVWNSFVMHANGIVDTLKKRAEIVFSNDQIQGETRSARIQLGHARTSPPRSLSKLCDWQDVWQFLHRQSCIWMVLFSQQSTSHFKNDTATNVINTEHENNTETLNLRVIANKIGVENYRALCYCLLTGIQVIIRSENVYAYRIGKVLSILLPTDGLCCHSSVYLTPWECMLLTVDFHVAVPKSSVDTFRIDVFNDCWSVKWEGDICSKSSNLLEDIVNLTFNDELDENVLIAQVECLMQKWISLSRIDLQTVKSKSNILNFMGVQESDLPLLDYWHGRLKQLRYV